MSNWATSEWSIVGRTITSTAPVAVVEFSADGTVLRCEGALDPLETQGCAGLSVAELLEHWPAMRQHVRRALDGESFTTLDQYKQRFYESWLSARRDQQGVQGVLWVLIDVSTRERRREDIPQVQLQLEHDVAGAIEQLELVEQRMHAEIQMRQRAENSARHCEERLHAVVDASPDALVLVSDTGQIIDWNLRADELFGWSRERIIGRQMVQTLFPPRCHAALREGLESYIQNGASPILNQRLELTALSEGGQEKPVELMISPMEIGRAITFAVFVRDITERLEAGQALRESEERTRLIINCAFDAIVTLDAEGRINEWNPQAQAIFGWELAQVVGKVFCEMLVSPEDRDRTRRLFDQWLGESPPPQRQRLEVHALRRDRQQFIAEMGLCSFTRGRHRILSAFIRDVTSRRRLERALRDSNARLESMVMHAPMAIVIYDARDRVTSWNKAAQELFGAPAADVIGHALPNVPQQDQREYQHIIQKVKNAQAVEVVTRRLHRDGTPIQVRMWAAPLQDESGQVIGRIETLIARKGPHENMAREVEGL